MRLNQPIPSPKRILKTRYLRLLTMNTFIDLNKTKKEKIVLDKPGKYTAFFHNLSGRFVFELNEKGIDLDIFGLFVGKGNDIFKVDTVQKHNAPSTTSNLLIKGVFDDESKFYYQGLIRIEKEGQQSHAYQKNQNIILSPETFVESKPFLEILANDVFCTHGSTTGKLNQEQMYYLESRGLAPKKAEELLIKGFIADIMDRLPAGVTHITPS